jgi:hypothetical protein
MLNTVLGLLKITSSTFFCELIIQNIRIIGSQMWQKKTNYPKENKEILQGTINISKHLPLMSGRYVYSMQRFLLGVYSKFPTSRSK